MNFWTVFFFFTAVLLSLSVTAAEPCPGPTVLALPGAYVPQCTREGLYHRLQCHPSTGQCWCVDSLTNEEVNGTRFGPGEETFDCFGCTFGVLTAPSAPGVYVPQCDEEGRFAREQCHGSTGECWCVNKRTGAEVDGTRTNPGSERADCQGACNTLKALVSSSTHLVVGVYVPDCNLDGSFVQTQCHESSGNCWCVDPQTGDRIQGSITKPGDPPPDCSQDQSQGQETETEGACAFHFKNATTGPLLIGAFIPQCRDDGTYMTEQCHGSTGYCWCVEPTTGEEIEGTRTAPSEDRIPCSIDTTDLPIVTTVPVTTTPLTAVLPEAVAEPEPEPDFTNGTLANDDLSGETVHLLEVIEAAPESVKTSDNETILPSDVVATEKACALHFKNATTGPLLIGAFIPQCHDDGTYMTEQCHGSTGYCWCVEPTTGEEIEGTRTAPSEDRIPCSIDTTDLPIVATAPVTTAPLTAVLLEPVAEPEPEPEPDFTNGTLASDDLSGETVHFLGVIEAAPESVKTSDNKTISPGDHHHFGAGGVLVSGETDLEVMRNIASEDEMSETHALLNETRSISASSENTELAVDGEPMVNVTALVGSGSQPQPEPEPEPVPADFFTLFEKETNDSAEVEVVDYTNPAIEPAPIGGCHRFIVHLTNVDPGTYVPTCEVDGSFTSQQCHPSTGHCWCVLPNTGAVLNGTDRGPDEEYVDCEPENMVDVEEAIATVIQPAPIEIDYPDSEYGAAFGICTDHAISVTILGAPVGTYIPQCQDDGSYDPRQCHYATEECWCVDTVTGVEIPSTRTKTKDAELECGQPCLAQQAQGETAPGAFVPQCDAFGNYNAKQCNSSTNECWCVNTSTGVRVEGSSSGGGDIDC